MQDTATAIYGHEIVSLVKENGGQLDRATLATLAAERFGKEAVFCNCHGDSFDLDSLLEFLDSHGKLTVSEKFVRVGHVPACDGHGH